MFAFIVLMISYVSFDVIFMQPLLADRTAFLRLVCSHVTLQRRDFFFANRALDLGTVAQFVSFKAKYHCSFVFTTMASELFLLMRFHVTGDGIFAEKELRTEIARHFLCFQVNAFQMPAQCYPAREKFVTEATSMRNCALQPFVALSRQSFH